MQLIPRIRHTVRLTLSRLAALKPNTKSGVNNRFTKLCSRLSVTLEAGNLPLPRQPGLRVIAMQMLSASRMVITINWVNGTCGSHCLVAGAEEIRTGGALSSSLGFSLSESRRAFAPKPENYLQR